MGLKVVNSVLPWCWLHDLLIKPYRNLSQEPATHIIITDRGGIAHNGLTGDLDQADAGKYLII
jgi:hypothetical protein